MNKKRKPIYCPICGFELGKLLGQRCRFYCMNCEKEVYIKQGKMKVYAITAGGNIRKIGEYDLEPETAADFKKKMIIQLDKNTGKEINRFKTQAEASRSTGAPEGGISNCLHGRAKTSGGYMWRFADV